MAKPPAANVSDGRISVVTINATYHGKENRMNSFEPDYRNVVDAAFNHTAARLPQYDHLIDAKVMEELLGYTFEHLHSSKDIADRREYARKYAVGLRSLGYDVVPFERCWTNVLNQSKSLCGKEIGPIQNRNDFERFPWAELPDRFFALYDEDFSLLCETMPPGMKAVGGIGNGIFEALQDCVRYSELCILMFEQPELYHDLISKIGDTLAAIWKTFLEKYGDAFCVLRFGDDLGFKTNTLISESDIRECIVPQYRTIIDLVHAAGKPFLLHSCGNIFGVMDDLINLGRIDAKHSNEDDIAPFRTWVEKYGERIGNFGGIDMNMLVLGAEPEIRRYTREVIDYSANCGGFACGSGNSIPDYVPARNYKAMLDAINEYRSGVGNSN
jgi:uroporphyrinogen decarboxylase